jgi:hypothetical protein
MTSIDKYKDYLENALSYYHSDDIFIKYFNKVPKSRYHTFKYCIDYFNNKNPVIVELGTSRSFVDGRFEGCNLDDTKYWEPNNPEKWDWSAGFFTKVFSESFPNSNLITVDLSNSHIKRCKYMNKNVNNINYVVSSSEDFLNNIDYKIDLLYLDTGDMTPIEETAQLHLREVKIVVERNLINKDGLILIDDVRNPTPKNAGEPSNYGKAKYSIPFLLQNGFKPIMNEYQVILIKK